MPCRSSPIFDISTVDSARRWPSHAATPCQWVNYPAHWGYTGLERTWELDWSGRRRGCHTRNPWSAQQWAVHWVVNRTRRKTALESTVHWWPIHRMMTGLGSGERWRVRGRSSRTPRSVERTAVSRRSDSELELAARIVSRMTPELQSTAPKTMTHSRMVLRWAARMTGIRMMRELE